MTRPRRENPAPPQAGDVLLIVDVQNDSRS